MSELKMASLKATISVLVIDDEAPVRDLLRRWLTDAGYHCRVSANGAEALRHLSERHAQVIVSDICMPDRSGLELLPCIQCICPCAAVIILSGLNNAGSATEALTNGACGYLTKPTTREALLKQVENALERRNDIARKRRNCKRRKRQLEAHIRERDFAQEQALERLIAASMYRDTETGAHIRRTGLYCELFAQAIGWNAEACEMIRLAAPLHDVGKIGIPDAVLQKRGALTDAEFETMKSHTVIGWKLLAGAPWPALEMAREIALNHHEWWNGQGYPFGVCNADIPLAARMLTIVDVYDALTHDRCYRPALSEPAAIEIMDRGDGTQFDPDLYEVFHSILPELRHLSREHPDECAQVVLC